MSDELPEIAELGHGISVIPLPLPFRRPKSVNAYVVRGDDRTVMIDCGVDWEPGATRLAAGFEALNGDPSDVDTLIVSHLHVDHVGMAPKLTTEYGWKLLMHERAAVLYERYNNSRQRARRMRELAIRSGTPASLVDLVGDLGDRPAYMPDLEPPDIVVLDGDTIDLGGRSLEVLHTPGHEQSHICLRDSRTGITFSGDHVLPRITPIIMWDEDAHDVLGDYLTSVQRLIDLDIGLTYPAHGSIVERGVARAEQILLHHHRRLDGMLDVVHTGPIGAWKVMTEMYRPNMEPVLQRMALRETVSYLEHLRIIERVLSFDEAGVSYYRT